MSNNAITAPQGLFSHDYDLFFTRLYSRSFTQFVQWYVQNLRHSASSFSLKTLLNLERVDFPKFVVREISRRDIFPSLRRWVPSFRFIAISQPLSKAIVRSSIVSTWSAAWQLPFIKRSGYARALHEMRDRNQTIGIIYSFLFWLQHCIGNNSAYFGNIRNK